MHNAVLTPEQLVKKDYVVDSILGKLSGTQKQRIRDGEYVSIVVNELSLEQKRAIGDLIQDVEPMSPQQQKDFAFLQSIMLSGITLNNRLAILQCLKENSGTITIDEIIGLGVSPLEAKVTNDFALLLEAEYKFSQAGTTFSFLSEEYDARQRSDAILLTMSMVAVTAGLAVERRLNYTPGKIPGGQKKGTTGNTTGSHPPVKPPEAAENPGGQAETGETDELVFGSGAKSAQKLQRQMDMRGWTNSSVQETYKVPFTTRDTINRATGNQATVFYNKDGSYVIVDNITKEIV